jgi:hypothetical protein
MWVVEGLLEGRAPSLAKLGADGFGDELAPVVHERVGSIVCVRRCNPFGSPDLDRGATARVTIDQVLMPDTATNDVQPVSSGQAWISFAIGVILLALFPRILQFWFTPASFTWTFNDRHGAPLAYVDSAFFLLDLGVLAVAVSLLLGAGLHFVRHRAGRIAGIAINTATALLNVHVTLATRGELGLQILPMIGVAIAVYQVIIDVNVLRAREAAPS